MEGGSTSDPQDGAPTGGRRRRRPRELGGGPPSLRDGQHGQGRPVLGGDLAQGGREGSIPPRDTMIFRAGGLAKGHEPAPGDGEEDCDFAFYRDCCNLVLMFFLYFLQM